MQHPIPRVFGVDQRPLAKTGGLRMKWLPPEGSDTRRLEQVLRGRSDGYVVRDGDAFEIAVPGVARDQVEVTANRITGGEGLAFREVVQLPEMQAVPGAHEDRWGDESGALHVDYYLTAPTRDELAAQVASIALPPGTRFAFEHTDNGWRSYVVRDEIELDGWSVASATATTDPNTNRPLVLLDFDREGARRFGELTSMIVGKKLAIMVRGEIKSAPIIMGEIRGGRASITMGAGTPEEMEREQHDLLDVLQLGALPAGGKLVGASYVEPTLDTTRLWLSRFVIGLVGGALVGGLAFLLLGWAKPVTRARRQFAGALPWHRIVVTLVAPAAIILVGKITIYGADEYAWSKQQVGIGTLGITPFITSAVLVELVALLIPGWRERRHAGAEARMPLTFVTAFATVALICYQGWWVAAYLDSAQMINHGIVARVLVIGSLAGGTMILLAAAVIVRWQGLGNGYGALYAFGFVLTLREHWASPILTGEHVVGGFALVAIALVFGVALRWRVAHRRIPSSSIAPLADAGGVIAIVVLVSQVPALTEAMQKAVDWSVFLRGHALPFVGLIALLTYAWSFAFARPVNDGWWRATVLSAVVLALVGAVVASTTHMLPGAAWLVDAMMIGITVAYLLDAYDDLQARRQKLVVAWTLHAPHFADAAEDALAARGIPSHMSASNVRALLSFFGPFVPIDVMVPVEHVEAATKLLARLSPTTSPASSSLAA